MGMAPCHCRFGVKGVVAINAHRVSAKTVCVYLFTKRDHRPRLNHGDLLLISEILQVEGGAELYRVKIIRGKINKQKTARALTEICSVLLRCPRGCPVSSSAQEWSHPDKIGRHHEAKMTYLKFKMYGKNKVLGCNQACYYLHSLLAAVDLQCTAAVFREGRHVEIEGRRSALALLKKTFSVKTRTREPVGGVRTSLEHLYTCEGVLADTECAWRWRGREWGIYLHHTENMVRICYIEEGGENHRFKWETKRTN